jgi:TRAP-type C4-dicarboxylate transport system substrate-binding protein
MVKRRGKVCGGLHIILLTIYQQADIIGLNAPVLRTFRRFVLRPRDLPLQEIFLGSSDFTETVLKVDEFMRRCQMEKGRSLQIVSGICFMLAVVLVPVMDSCAAPIELSWVSIVSKNNNQEMQAFDRAFIQRVNEKAKGELFIRYRGGPETITAFDQGKAVQKGVVDIANVACGFYEPIAPGVGGAMLTLISLEEERKPGGGYDFLNELHKKGGLYYLGRGTPTDEYFALNLRKKVVKRQDFVGLRLGTATVSRACVEAWGATVVSLSMDEYYTAMEHGMVDGIASCPWTLLVSAGIHEVTKYAVDHGFYQSTLAVIMNLDKWNKLPKHLQTLMTESIIQSEKEMRTYYAGIKADAKQKMAKSGIEFYKFPPDTAKWFLDTAYNAAWEYQMKRYPDVTPKLKQLLSGK